MGIDLTLMPVSFVLEGEEYCCQTRLRLERDYDLQDAIRELPSNEAPGKCAGYFGDNYESTTVDAYDNLLRYVRAGAFTELKAEDAENIAALAYIKALPADHKIILYWN